MKRRFFAILTLAFVVTTPLTDVVAAPNRRSDSIVHIDGARYYIHIVEKGDTLYSLAKVYNSKVEDILAANPDLESGLNIDFKLRIPIKVYEAEDEEIDTEVVTETKEERAARIKAEEEIKEMVFKENFDQHIVKQGETLYSISRQYEISVSMILADNLDLDPAHLAIGQSVNIRKSELGLSAEEQTVAELEKFSQDMSIIAPEGFVYHLVAKDDTLGGLAKEYGMSEGEIKSLNKINQGNSIEEGTIVLLRAGGEHAVVAEADMEPIEEPTLEKGEIRALNNEETLEIALLLPLSIRDYAMKPFVEFYQGFLMGVEELKAQGRNVVVNLFNTERSSEAVSRIVANPAFKRSNLIVGPVYEEFLPTVLADAKRRKVPVVSPLATLKSSDSPLLFQMAPNPDHRYDKMDDLFGIEKQVTLVYGETNDKAYEGEVRDIMARYNREIERYDYKYEHPSVISERERVAKEELKFAEAMADSLGMMLDSVALDSLTCKPSPSDLTPLICNEAVGNIFFVLSDNETEVDRILSAFASAYTAQVAANRGSGRKMSEELNFSVIANPEWRNYENIDKMVYFRDRAYNYPSYLAVRDAKVVRDFDGRYATEFGDFATQYAYRGYDVAKIFGEGMYGDIEYNMMGKSYTPLQTEYIFNRAENGKRTENTNWVRVRYNLDFTLTIE